MFALHFKCHHCALLTDFFCDSSVRTSFSYFSTSCFNVSFVFCSVLTSQPISLISLRRSPMNASDERRLLVDRCFVKLFWDDNSRWASLRRLRVRNNSRRRLIESTREQRRVQRRDSSSLTFICGIDATNRCVGHRWIRTRCWRRCLDSRGRRRQFVHFIDQLSNALFLGFQCSRQRFNLSNEQ